MSEQAQNGTLQPASSESESQTSELILRIDGRGLSALNARPSFFAYIRNLYRRRQYILADSRARAFQGNRDYILGAAWVVLEPFLNAAMYGLIFGFLFSASKGVENYIGYLVLGIIYFAHLNRCLVGGAGLVKANRAMLSSFHFPKAAVVFSQSLYRLYDFIPSAIVGVLFALGAQWGKPISWTLVLLPFLIFLLHVFGLGLMLITSRLSAFIPDIRVLLNFASRFWLYTSGIFFSAERFIHHEIVYTIITLNPAYQFIQAIRDVTIYGTFPELNTWLTLSAWAFGTLFFGLLYFWEAEERYVKTF